MGIETCYSQQIELSESKRLFNSFVADLRIYFGDSIDIYPNRGEIVAPPKKISITCLDTQYIGYKISQESFELSYGPTLLMNHNFGSNFGHFERAYLKAGITQKGSKVEYRDGTILGHITSNKHKPLSTLFGGIPVEQRVFITQTIETVGGVTIYKTNHTTPGLTEVNYFVEPDILFPLTILYDDPDYRNWLFTKNSSKQ